MKLIAKKPCSFGGKAFFINDEIPASVVLNPKQQEDLGVLTIVSDEEVAAELPGADISRHICLQTMVEIQREGIVLTALCCKGGLQSFFVL